MARRAVRGTRSNTANLEFHNGTWRVTVAVPKAAQSILGVTRLKVGLRTDSLSIANQLKVRHVADLKAQIQTALNRTPSDPLMQQALSLAEERQKAASASEREELDLCAADLADEIRGDPIDEHPGHGGPQYTYDPAGLDRAQHFLAIATGQRVLLKVHHETYLGQQDHLKARTLADDVRAIGFLERWCASNNIPATLQDVTPQRANAFIDDLPSLAGGIQPPTVKKYRNRLARYWAWLVRRQFVSSNVWQGVEIRMPLVLDHEKERAFTGEELRALLDGPASPQMADLMHIAALSGARLDAIVCLSVGDCQGGAFRFKPQKKETAFRRVPIHSALVDIVSRRMEGRADDAPLFPEWPPPQNAGSMRERSFKASNAFTAYRRAVGVNAVVEGRRRAQTNFHSFRRWFVTMAEQAGQPEHIISSVVGHRRKGMSMAVYSSGPSSEQFRRCVESVKLPGG